MTDSAEMHAIAALLAGAPKRNAEMQKGDRIRAILEAMIRQPIPPPFGLVGLVRGIGAIPDFERHAMAETREQLQDRISALDAAVKHSRALLEVLASDVILRIRLCLAIDEKERLSFDNTIRLNGIVPSAISALCHVIATAEKARLEAEAEYRVQFPVNKGRPRDPRPYRIADELARFYLRARKERPTYGTGYQGTPVGDYTKALTDLFKELGIRKGVRGPAQSAIAAITEDDINREEETFPTLASVLNRGRVGDI